MKRFNGLMPSDEVSIYRTYMDEDGYRVSIQAGNKGWTVIYADYSTNWKDEELCAEVNFEHAYKVAVDNVGKLIAVNSPDSEDVYCEADV